MKLHYKLLPHSNRGLLQTTDTPLLDTDSGFLMSFDLPEPGEYVAVLTAQDGREHTVRISSEPVPIPPQLLKPQLIGVKVLQIKEAKPWKRWVCPTIRITSLAAQGKLMLDAMPDLLGLPGEFNALAGEYDAALGRIAALEAEISVLKAQTAEQVQTLTEAYNNSAAAHNALMERIALIEANYDPLRM